MVSTDDGITADKNLGNIGFGRRENDLLQDVFTKIEIIPEPDRSAFGSRIDNHRIKLVAGFELANRQIERQAAAGCRQIERIPEINARLPMF